MRVVVVGGGISALAAAAAVRRERPAAEVVVLEAADRVGGKLRLAEVGGVTVDVGAESILNRRPEGVALARAAGLSAQVVHPQTTTASIWTRGALRRLPRSVLGVPVDTADLRASGVLERDGLTSAEAGMTAPPLAALEGDASVGELVEQRYGPEVVDRLVEPLLGGVYAGHARELSVRAAAPQVLAHLTGSPPPAPADDVPVFAGIRGGVGALPLAVAAGLDVRTSTTVRELARTSTGWRLVAGPAPAPVVVEADAVVLAIPPPSAARLLAGVAPVASRELGAVECASMAVVTMAFRRADVPPVPGSGFLVPPVERRQVKASTFSSAKWAWVDEASADLVLLRTSVGRHREEHELQRPDEELVDASVADLRAAVGVTGLPVDSHVARWGGGLPQYAVGHLDRVRRIRESVGAVPALAVCGAAYDGIGIPACIASAERAVRDLLERQEPSGTLEP